MSEIPWFRVDDTLASHPKARAAGLAAMGLWVVAGAYASQYLTEGAVPRWFVESWPSGKKLARSLVDAGLWETTDDGWLFHQWDERQPTKEQVEADREAARVRQAKWRATKRDKQRDGKRDTAVSHGVTDGVTNASPARPGPSSNEDVPPRLDVESLCQRLADRIEANGSPRPSITQRWRDECRRMLDRDQRDVGRTERLIDWCQANSFWRANVLSMPKFREQYDKMRLQAIDEWERGKSKISPDGELDVDAVLGPEKFQPPTPPDDMIPGSPEWQAWQRSQRDAWVAAREAKAREVLARRAS